MAAVTWNPFVVCSTEQIEQLEAFSKLLKAYNRKVNLVSPSDIPFLHHRHVLHALSLTNRVFPDKSAVVDWGTGGGLPAIPLAICFPGVTIHAVDAIEKKVLVVRTIAKKLGLKNLHTWHARAESWPGRAHYSVSRATAPLVDLWRWHNAIKSDTFISRDESTWRPGLICLKGGDLAGEISHLLNKYPQTCLNQYPLRPLLGREYFDDKYIVEVYEKGVEEECTGD